MTQDEKQTRETTATALPSAEKKETVGEELRRARLAKDQDLRDIAAYLCIRYQFLQALEDSRYKELPGEAYANGFVRTYASYLGLDPSDIITQARAERSGEKRTPRREGSRRGNGKHDAGAESFAGVAGFADCGLRSVAGVFRNARGRARRRSRRSRGGKHHG